MTPLDFEQARHLTARTGFGAAPETIKKLIGLSRQQAVTELLTASRNYLSPQPVFHSVHQLRKIGKADKLNDTRLRSKLHRQDIKDAKNWCVEQALTNPNSLQEKMTWFWHNHFTSSSRRSGRSTNLLMTQSLLIRQYAMGDFSTLLSSISHDPLMLIYLDGINNRKGKPNENFARELLELFTLGEGHYTENDVKEIARAFTGLRLDNVTQRIVRHDKHFDAGKKRILGKHRAFNSNDVLNLLLKQSRTAELIAEKMWSEFISIEPFNKVVTQAWAATFRENKYDITALVEAVLMSDTFWNPKYRGQLIKSPLDLVIGTLRSFDLGDKRMPLDKLRVQLYRMGQDLYTPPNVKGWPGGVAWIDDIRLPVRQQFLRQLVRGKGNLLSTEKTPSMMSMSVGSMRSTKQKNNNALLVTTLPDLPVEQWEPWLLPIQPATEVQLLGSKERLRAILFNPAYQLK